ncbi:MAG: hypothetical protein CM15mV6_0310 [uncultured marine virus]|nr:MAG: hypothetical protein CM15mV6_0310 [uncultured marine virus]
MMLRLVVDIIISLVNVNLNTDDTDLKSPPKQTSVGWTHVLFHDGQPVSNYYDLFIPIVDTIQDRLGRGTFELFRLRLAMLHHNHVCRRL